MCNVYCVFRLHLHVSLIPSLRFMINLSTRNRINILIVNSDLVLIFTFVGWCLKADVWKVLCNKD